MTEFETARRELADLIFEAFHIPQFVDWLARQLG